MLDKYVVDMLGHFMDERAEETIVSEINEVIKPFGFTFHGDQYSRRILKGYLVRNIDEAVVHSNIPKGHFIRDGFFHANVLLTFILNNIESRLEDVVDDCEEELRDAKKKFDSFTAVRKKYVDENRDSV
jgi:2-polyprenyl-3-methyl-5-hydroxy-6-metoxy-1,4-benzoquinol methylase